MTLIIETGFSAFCAKLKILEKLLSKNSVFTCNRTNNFYWHLDLTAVGWAEYKDVTVIKKKKKKFLFLLLSHIPTFCIITHCLIQLNFLLRVPPLAKMLELQLLEDNL